MEVEGAAREEGDGEEEGEEEEEGKEEERGCGRPKAWVVGVAALPFLALGVSLTCIGYLGQRDGKGTDGGGLGQHFRIAGPVILAVCALVLFIFCVCSRPGLGRVGTEAVAPPHYHRRGNGGARMPDWKEGGSGAVARIGIRSSAIGDPDALWDSCTLGHCRCPLTPGKDSVPRYPVSMMVPPLLKVIPPTPESPSVRRENGAGRSISVHHLLLTPLKLKEDIR